MTATPRSLIDTGPRILSRVGQATSSGTSQYVADIAEAAAVTEVTIRNRYKGLKTTLDPKDRDAVEVYRQLTHLVRPA
jgi:hypothetical protein